MAADGFDLAALLSWGRKERERASQRALVEEEAALAPAVATVTRSLWRSRAVYSRDASTWDAAGIAGVGAAPAASGWAEGEVDVQLRVGAAGELHVSILPLVSLPASRKQRPSAAAGAGLRDARSDGMAAALDCACDTEELGGCARIELTLVSQQQLFAHQLYPSAAAIARLLDGGDVDGLLLDVRGASVLELGAGPALPCIIAALGGAAAVVASDFPDRDMLRNTQANLDANLPARLRGRCRAVGHAWGADCAPLLSARRELTSSGEAGADGFDLVVLSDLLYELEHEALLRSCAACLSRAPRACVLVAFQPHDLVQLGRQLRFFALASQPPYSLHARRLRCIHAPPMFHAGAAADSAARRVHVYVLWRAEHGADCREGRSSATDSDGVAPSG
jgi:nicotinamide N-methyltransferase